MDSDGKRDDLHLPAPTAWPVVMALGLALAATGLVSTLIVSAVGGVLALAGAVGWFLQVLPRERQVVVTAREAPVVIARSPHRVTRSDGAGPNRARMPLETYPISAGLKGGLAGGVAMAAMATFFGIATHRSLWYAANLLGAVVYARPQVSVGWLAAFHPGLLAMALLLHLVTSVLVGLLYGALLPMLPRQPILLGGVFAPVAWTGLLHGILNTVNPVLNQHIDWRWFLASQVAYGLVAGMVVLRQVRVPTWQYQGPGADRSDPPA